MKTIALTSKKQLTIPAEYVRALGLEHVSKLRASVADGKLVIEREPELHDIMAPLWQKTRRLNKGSASDASIGASVDDYYRTKTV